MTTFKHACPRCGAQVGELCLTSKGGQQSLPHQERLALVPKKELKLRHTSQQKIKMLEAKLARAEYDLMHAKAELADLRKESKRLRRLLNTTDVGTIVTLRQQLSDALARVRYLQNEILD